MSGFTAAGSTISIVEGVPATFDQLGYDALAFVEVGEVISAGEFGGDTNFADFDTLSNPITQSAIGNKTMVETPLQLAYDVSDSGQSLIEATSTTGDASYFATFSLKFELQDGSAHFATGFIKNYKPNLSGANDLVGASCTVKPLREFFVGV